MAALAKRRLGILKQITFCVYRHIIRNANTVSRNEWMGVVGLEVHAQIDCESKLFSGAGKQFGAPTNSQVSPFDAALPGTLPVINKKCIEAAVVTALALSCNINMVSFFDRKHYFYADLPAGYQITQQRKPIAENGKLEFSVYTPGVDKTPTCKSVNIVKLQLEQDSGKSLHDDKMRQSLIDLNRAGTGLMEIVTAPDFSSGADASSFVKELQRILKVIGTCDGKMAEGSLRVDANISVHKSGEPLGVRTEVKNLNSIKGVSHAIDYEIKRQIKELNKGVMIVNETRSFDFENGKTVPMRDKERLQDYRFMPEPNLPPLRLYDKNIVPPQDTPSNQVINIDVLKQTMPDLPEQQRQKLQENYGLNFEQADSLVGESSLQEYYTDVVEISRDDPITIYNLISNQLFTLLNKENISIEQSPVCAERFGELVILLQDRTISLNTFKQVLEVMHNEIEQKPGDIIDNHDWKQITDRHTIEKFCLDVLENNPKQVKQYANGKKKVFNVLVAQVHKASCGRADPLLVNYIFQNKLNDWLNKS